MLVEKKSIISVCKYYELTPRHSNITAVQPLAVDTGMVPRTAVNITGNTQPICHLRHQTNVPSILNDRRVHLPYRAVILQ